MSWLGRVLFIVLTCWPSQMALPPASLTAPFAKAWSYLTTDTLRYNGAVTDGQNVYVPLAGGQLLALKLITGERVWATRYQGDWAAQLQVGDQILYAAIVSATDAREKIHSSLLALDKRTGELLWQRSFDERITSLTYQRQGGNPGADRLYVGTATGSVIAMDPSAKEPVWQFRSQDAVRGHVRQQDGVVYVGSDDSHLYALDAATGAERWRFKTRGAVRAGVEVSSDRVYLGSFDGSVYCLDKHTGKRRWAMRTGAAIEAQPVLVNQTLIVSSYDNFVYALDPNSGEPRWKSNLSGRITADPIAEGGAVLISVLRAHGVVVLRADDGQQINSLELGSGFEIVAAPVLAGEVLVLTTDQGIIGARQVSPGAS